MYIVIIETSSQVNSQSDDGNNRPNETVHADNIQLVDTSLYNLEVGSLIQYGEPPQCGVIKWIGNLPNQTEVTAGLEMVWYGRKHILCFF